jgi:hypothetical protein
MPKITRFGGVDGSTGGDLCLSNGADAIGVRAGVVVAAVIVDAEELFF